MRHGPLNSSRPLDRIVNARLGGPHHRRLSILEVWISEKNRQPNVGVLPGFTGVDLRLVI